MTSQRIMTSLVGLCVVALLGACGPLETAPNQAPILRLSSPQIAPVRVPVTFDASASRDDEGIVMVRAQFGDGSAEEVFSALILSHRFDQPGRFEMRVEVEDTDGETAFLHRWLNIVERYTPPYCDELSPCLDAASCIEGVCYVEGDSSI